MVCAFPIHVWSIVSITLDFGWISVQRGTLNAIGFASYALVFALFESFIFFLFILILSSLLPKQWKEDKVFAQLSIISFVISVWAIANPVYFLMELTPPGIIWRIFFHVNRFSAITLPIFIILIILTVTLPIYFIIKRESLTNKIKSISERIVLLSSIYVIIDIIAFINIVIRNT